MDLEQGVSTAKVGGSNPSEGAKYFKEVDFLPLVRLQSQQELLEFVVTKYRAYKKVYDDDPTDFVSRYYLKDIMNDLLIIQRFASGNRDSEGRPESLADLS